MNKKEGIRIPAVGGSSLLVIFAVLCLTMLALLCLSTVQAAERLNRASAEAVKKYYEADCEAEEVLARLRMGEVPEGVSLDGTSYHYSCLVSESQKLQVTVENQDNRWKVICWQAVSEIK